MKTSNSSARAADLKKGSRVRVTGAARAIIGRVISLGPRRARIETDRGIVEVPTEALQAAQEPPKSKRAFEGGVGFIRSRRGSPGDIVADGGDSIDLHGMTVEEALSALDEFLDRSALNHRRRAVIVHGKGSGRLRDAVRRVLASRSDVRSFRFAPPSAGSYGATEVEFE